MTMSKSYSELMEIPDFYERLKYLQDVKYIGDPTFGSRRYLNQVLYRSYKWKHIRGDVILRDEGMDLAHPDFPINGLIYIHHLNPLTVEDILEERDCVFDLENLVCCSMDTHNSLHYSREIERRDYVPRKPNDTCPWR